MAENPVAEDSAPLLVKDEANNLGKSDTELESVGAGVNPNGVAWHIFGLVSQRSTYYWIAFIAQFSQVVLQTIGFAVTRAHPQVKGEDPKAYNDLEVSFLSSGIYSLFSFFILTTLLLPESKLKLKQPLNAGRHFNLTMMCAMMNIYLVMILMPAILDHGKQVYTDDILPVIVPLICGFMFVAALATTTATLITYKAAKRSRGAEMVPDPNYRVPAWQLATTEESQGLSSRNAIQLPC